MYTTRFAVCASGIAPSNPSPQKQACIAQAQKTLNDTVSGINEGFNSDLVGGAVTGAVFVPVAGCVGGAIATIELGPGAVLGCALGAAAATNPVTLITGAGAGAAGAAVWDIGKVLWAKYQYSQQVAACQ